ncbi:glycosyltransferase, partial [Calditrichota bacterium]
FEVIYVNDACPDNSLRELRLLAQEFLNVKIVTLKRNVGQLKAVMVGLTQSVGDYVVIMDADLQDPPEAITDLYAKCQEGYDTVFAGRRGLYQSLPRIVTSVLYKFTMHILTGVPRDAGMYMLINQKVLREILRLSVTRPFIIGQIGLSKASNTSIPVRRNSRDHGESSYSTMMRFRMGMSRVGYALAFRLGLSQMLYREYISSFNFLKNNVDTENSYSLLTEDVYAIKK